MRRWSEFVHILKAIKVIQLSVDTYLAQIIFVSLYRRASPSLFLKTSQSEYFTNAKKMLDRFTEMHKDGGTLLTYFQSVSLAGAFYRLWQKSLYSIVCCVVTITLLYLLNIFIVRNSGT